MADQSIAGSVREFMIRLTKSPVRDDDDIFASGYANSMVAMQLVAFVEQRFGIEIDGEDLELDNFRSVDAIAAFVERKQAAAA